MTALLEQAVAALQGLPEAAQDHFAVQILAEVNASDDGWERRLVATMPELDQLANEAIREFERRETLPVDPESL